MGTRDALVESFREIHPKFSRFYANILEKAAITLPQYVLLNQLEHAGTISMTEASKRLGITKPAITHLVDRLEEKKCLKRLPHPKDRRVALLELQPRGAKIVANIQARSLQVLLRAYDQFNVSENDIISRFYAAVSKVLDEQLARNPQ